LTGGGIQANEEIERRLLEFRSNSSDWWRVLPVKIQRISRMDPESTDTGRESSLSAEWQKTEKISSCCGWNGDFYIGRI